MKIDPSLKPVTLPLTVDNRAARPQGAPLDDSGQTDVSLSARASQLKQLEAQLAAIPVVDRARVDSIKQAIAAGHYTINPDNIAEGLINSVKEMLHAAK
ncbi:MAG: flagellar biosynthesis anti-sigma factor FlgM [Thiobacillus sp.]